MLTEFFLGTNFFFFSCLFLNLNERESLEFISYFNVVLIRHISLIINGAGKIIVFISEDLIFKQYP